MRKISSRVRLRLGSTIRFLEINGPGELKFDGRTISTAQADYMPPWSRAEGFIKAEFKRLLLTVLT